MHPNLPCLPHLCLAALVLIMLDGFGLADVAQLHLPCCRSCPSPSILTGLARSRLGRSPTGQPPSFASTRCWLIPVVQGMVWTRRNGGQRR